MWDVSACGTVVELSPAIAYYIETFYNSTRRHSSINS
jgi:hypothetical protein